MHVLKEDNCINIIIQIDIRYSEKVLRALSVLLSFWKHGCFDCKTSGKIKRFSYFGQIQIVDWVQTFFNIKTTGM